MLPIQLKINGDRPLLRREGFALSKTAKAFRGAIRRNDATSPTGFRFVPADLGEDQVSGIPVDDPGLYQFPETGVVQLKPSALRSDLMENEDFAPFWVPLSQLRYRTYGDPLRAELFEIPQDHLPSQPRVLSIQREDTTDLVGITPAAAHLAALDITDRWSLVWLAETTFSLYPNEGFSVIIRPFGTASDRPAANFGIAFGYRWFLTLNMAGGAALYEYAGDSSTGREWIRRKQFGFAQGGVDPTQEFQLTVIPHMIDAVSFLFSQAAQGNPAQASDYRAAVSTGFMYECRKNGFNPPYNSSMKQSIKLDGAPIVIATRKDRYQLAFMLHRVRYLESGMTLAAETIDEPKPARTPTVNPIGYFGQNRAGEPGARVQFSKTNPTIGAMFTNENGATWTPAKDTKLVASTWLKPSGASLADAVYSPEIWAMEYKILPETHTVADSEYDLSESWYKIAGRLSSHPDSDVLSMRLRRTSDWQNLYKLDGPVDLTVDDYKLFEGELLQYRPTIEGKIDFFSDDVAIAGDNAGKVRVSPEVYDDAEATGFWDSLNDTSASHFLSLTKRSYGALLYDVFRLRGDEDASIDIAADLYSLEVDGWEAANDWKTTNENASLGDVVRTLIALYGMQGNGQPRELRVIRRDGMSKAFLSPAYDPTVTPPHVFYLHTRALPEDVRALEDSDRWDGVEGVRYWKVFSPLELTRRRADYNAVKSFCSSGNAEGADMFASFISPHPNALEDADNWDFQGRVRSRTYGPNENALASTLNELQRVTRRRYDTESRAMLVAVVDAEFQPGKIDTDDFVMIVLPALSDDSGEAFLEGDPVTLGAFRVVEIAYEFELSPPAADPAPETIDIPAQDFETKPAIDEETGEGPAAGGYPESEPTGEVGLEVSPLTGMIGSTARRASWSARYTLEYVGEVTSETWPMFSTVLPDYGRAPS
ncbi:hypothetical protein [Caudoviricetes sp.]|nr:hypothetical protein [Caudoviricetes sp.]